jgi:hypothetical protein
VSLGGEEYKNWLRFGYRQGWRVRAHVKVTGGTWRVSYARNLALKILAMFALIMLQGPETSLEIFRESRSSYTFLHILL